MTNPTPTTSAGTRTEPGDEPSLLRRAWNRLGRADLHPPTRAFWVTFAFAAIAASSLVTAVVLDEPVGTTPLPALMMVVFGLGEISREPNHVAVTRLVGFALAAFILVTVFTRAG